MTVSFLIITQLTLTRTLVPPFCHCLPLPSCVPVPVGPPNGGEGRAPLEPQGHLGGISPHRKFCCSHGHTAQQMLKVEQAGGEAAFSPGSKGHTAGQHSTFPQSAPQSPCPRHVPDYRDLDSHEPWPTWEDHCHVLPTSSVMAGDLKVTGDLRQKKHGLYPLAKSCSHCPCEAQYLGLAGKGPPHFPVDTGHGSMGTSTTHGRSRQICMGAGL